MIEQRTLEWYRARLGRVTGSSVGALMVNPRKGSQELWSETAKSYINAVAAERLLVGEFIEDDAVFADFVAETNISSKAMELGTEREADAREAYARAKGVKVEETGSVQHRYIDNFASSPDGLVGEDGCLEIKCPTPATFGKYLFGLHTAEDLKKINSDYYWQCVAHMAVTGRAWCDFVVYNPWFEVPMLCVRIHRDLFVESALIERVEAALDNIANRVMDAVEGRRL